MANKILKPVRCKTGVIDHFGYVKIEFSQDGRLSITGVIGPMHNGNCYGSCGQCVDEIREGEPAEGWTREMVDRLCDIWDKWHLNDMRPYCEHQKELGWRELAQETVSFYNYRLNREATEKKRAAERAATSALRDGKVFVPSKEQTMYENLPNFITITKQLEGEQASFYEPRKPLYAGDKGFVTTERRGWVRFEDFEEGILCKPCPVCGYKYGTSWNKEEVPKGVIDWLFALPDSDTEPAWI